MTTDKQNELLIEVDENNDIVGPITRGEAHNGSNRIYRTIFILLKNKDNRFLIQKRSGTKDLFPNCWDLSVGGHVLWKDEYLTSAIRELEEELGIKAKDDEMKFLAEVPVSLPSSREIFHVFEYNLKESDKIKLEANEVDIIKWVTFDELLNLIEKKPDEWYERPVQVARYLREHAIY